MTERDPALRWNPLSEAHSQARITPIQWIVHTAVDALGPTNLHGYFENHTSLESHTWLRWDRHEQMMVFNRRADANYKANQFWVAGRSCGAISTETEDDGRPHENPWNAYQLNELVRFGVWLNRTFGIPPHLPTGPFEPGMGYHSLFPGVWSNVKGKTCPGSKRIHQFKTIVLPRIQAALNNGDDDLAKYEEDLAAIKWGVGALGVKTAEVEARVRRIESQIFGKEGGRKITDELDALIRGVRVLLEDRGIDPTDPKIGL